MSRSLGFTDVLPLPAELLLDIFKLATPNPCRNIDRYVDLPPFESIESRMQLDDFDVALETKLSITLACSAFRRICSEIMYEDLRVGRGVDVLADVLERSEVDFPGHGVGRTVKRAILFPITSEDSSPGQVCGHTRRILACCPNIRVINRPRRTIKGKEKEDLVIDEPSANRLQFHSLERIDWTSCPADDPPHVAEMPQSVWSAESLTALSVGVQEWSRFTGMRETETVNVFSKIRTLRVRSIDAFGRPGQRIFVLELPSLRRLIMDQPDSMYALFSTSNYCDRVKTIEFGLHRGFLEHDYIMILLIYCPNTTDLYLPVFTTFVTRRSRFTYNVRHVVLHAAVEEGAVVDDSWKWQQLSEQFEALCGDESRFTALQRITLFGSEWREFVGSPRFMPFLRIMHSKNVELVVEDEAARFAMERVNVMGTT